MLKETPMVRWNRNLIGSCLLLVAAIACGGCTGDVIDEDFDDLDEEVAAPEKTEQRMSVGVQCKDGSGNLVAYGTGYPSLTYAQYTASGLMADHSDWSCIAFTSP